ncbi:hypothetical protein DDZ16_02025 [Marinilabilia rubra]|uniref:Uncharacterized protein n=1 Tax=Marinilabilia rubra TaxID=2162893 RepID=A0A2U2BDY6_9BACT|nr:hypothetical protein DDZ16_02025 [Marinilabilia rubra]
MVKNTFSLNQGCFKGFEKDNFFLSDAEKTGNFSILPPNKKNFVISICKSYQNNKQAQIIILPNKFCVQASYYENP